MTSNYSKFRDNLEEMLKDQDFKPYITQWIDYQANHQNRLKMHHDLRLKDGTELKRYRPNANSWYKMSPEDIGPAHVNDNDVAFIRLSETQHWS